MLRRDIPSRLLPILLAGVAASGFAVACLAQAPPLPPPHRPNDIKQHRLPRNAKREMHQEVDALERQWRQAQLSDDIDTMDKLLSDDFLGTTANGQVVTKAQQLDRMKTHALALTQLDISDTKIKLIGQVAIVNSLAQIAGMMDEKPIEGAFRYTRVYQRLPNGTWKITSFSATRAPNVQIGNSTKPAPPAS